eukprot:4906159-Amphidinium_carterae.1
MYITRALPTIASLDRKEHPIFPAGWLPNTSASAERHCSSKVAKDGRIVRVAFCMWLMPPSGRKYAQRLLPAQTYTQSKEDNKKRRYFAALYDAVSHHILPEALEVSTRAEASEHGSIIDSLKRKRGFSPLP